VRCSQKYDESTSSMMQRFTETADWRQEEKKEFLLFDHLTEEFSLGIKLSIST
jgi:hypothetical protein